MWKRYVGPTTPIIDLAFAEKGKVSPFLQRIAQFLLTKVTPSKLDRAIQSYTSYRLWTTIPRSKPMIVKSSVSKPEGQGYLVHVIIDEDRIFTSCTCYDFRKHTKPCKHVAMALLDLFPSRILSLIISPEDRQKYYECHESVV